MNQNASQIRERDVINVCTGKRLGFICDFIIDCTSGKVTAILVSDHFFSLGGGKNAVCIPWEKICCIGNDAVLVRIEEDDGCEENRCYDPCVGRENKRKRGGWFFG